MLYLCGLCPRVTKPTGLLLSSITLAILRGRFVTCGSVGRVIGGLGCVLCAVDACVIRLDPCVRLS